MNDPPTASNDRARRRVIIFLMVWSIVVAASIAHPMLTEPTGDGFTRGLNRTTILLSYQLAALAVAIWMFTISLKGRGLLSRRIRIVAAIPLTIHVLIVLTIVGMFRFN